MSDGTHTKIWHTSNVFAAVPTWDTGAQFDGIYNLIRPSNNTPGSLLVYKSSDPAVFDTTYDFTISDYSSIFSLVSGHGTYVAGVGYQNSGSGAVPWTVTINAALGTWNLTNIIITYSSQTTSVGALRGVFSVPGAGGSEFNLDSSNPAFTGTYTHNFDVSAYSGGLNGATIAFENSNNVFDAATTNTIIKIRFIGGLGAAEVLLSTDYGATVGSPISVGDSPGTVGGFDLQHNGTVSYAAAKNLIRKATTLGGSYSDDQTLTAVNAPLIEIPWYTRNSLSSLNSGSSPEYIFGLDQPDGSGHTLYWVVSGTPVNITPSISGNPGIATNANCLATWKGKYVGAVLSFAGVLHLVTSTTGGSSWIDRGAVNAPYVRVRRQSPTPGQLYMAGNVLDYSGTFGKNVISKTKPSSDPLQFFEPFG